MKRFITSNFSNLVFVFAITILLATGVFSAINLITLLQSNDRASQALVTINTLEEILNLVVGAETAQRGFVVTGDEAYLDPYFNAIDPEEGLTEHIAKLQSLLEEEPEQEERLQALIPLIYDRLEGIEQVIFLRQGQGFEPAQEVILSGEGKETMDAIRQLFNEMKMAENDLLLYWSEMSSTYLRNTMIAMTSAAIVSVLLFGTSFYFLNREVKERRLAQNELYKLNQELDQRVKERSDELTQSNQKYMHVLDTMIEGCQVLGFDWRYLYVNDVVAKQGRVTKEEMPGRTMMDLYPGIEETPLFETLSRCMKDRTPARIETQFVYPDRQTGWFELSIEPVEEGLFILSMDITERKHSEEAIQQQLQRLKALRSIDVAILGTTDLRLTLRTVLDEAKLQLHVDIVQIQLFNQAEMLLETIAVTGNHTEEIQSFASKLDEGINGKAAMQRRTEYIDMIHEDESPDRFLSAIIKEDGRAVYSTPLIVKGNLIGVFNVILRRAFKAPKDWIDFFETLAGQTAMAIDSVKSFEELQRSNLDLALAYDTTIEGWSNALELRDQETEGHTLRVTKMTLKLAELAGMSNAELVHVRRGALLHDIGKMGIPDQILLKPDQLTDEEWEIMRKHPTYAYELLLPISYLHPALDIPYCHHEKWDGSGYPRGLKGEQIPLSARLFAVADVWDALRSDRPYRKAWEEDKVIEYVQSLSNTHFDPKAVEIFMQALKTQSL